VLQETGQEIRKMAFMKEYMVAWGKAFIPETIKKVILYLLHHCQSLDFEFKHSTIASCLIWDKSQAWVGCKFKRRIRALDGDNALSVSSVLISSRASLLDSVEQARDEQEWALDARLIWLLIGDWIWHAAISSCVWHSMTFCQKVVPFSTATTTDPIFVKLQLGLMYYIV
jgi:hypothetical protein